MNGSLIEDLGFLENSVACQQILQGNYTLLTGMDRCTKELLIDIKIPISIKKINLKLYLLQKYSKKDRNKWGKEPLPDLWGFILDI